MKFSVIVPVYNVEKYLEECIVSLINQSFDDYEIILIDDGSTDSSPMICDRYANDYDYIKVVHKENQGLISARRIGLQNASGDYIIFVDSDDLLKTDCLKAFNTVLQEDIDMLVYRWEGVDLDKKLIGVESAKMFEVGKVEKEVFIREFITNITLSSICLKVCKRELYDIYADYSEYYSLKNAEDYFQSIPIVFAANTFYFMDDTFYQYRMNPNSITHAYDKDKYKNLDIIKPRLYEYMAQNNYDTEEMIKGMFDTYLLNIYDEIIYTGKYNFNTEIYNEILGFKYVVLAEKYIDGSNLDEKKKRVIRWFYKRKWNAIRLNVMALKMKILIYDFLHGVIL